MKDVNSKFEKHSKKLLAFSQHIARLQLDKTKSTTLNLAYFKVDDASIVTMVITLPITPKTRSDIIMET